MGVIACFFRIKKKQYPINSQNKPSRKKKLEINSFRNPEHNKIKKNPFSFSEAHEVKPLKSKNSVPKSNSMPIGVPNETIKSKAKL